LFSFFLFLLRLLGCVLFENELIWFNPQPQWSWWNVGIVNLRDKAFAQYAKGQKP
jgi:hypothetical protein